MKKTLIICIMIMLGPVFSFVQAGQEIEFNDVQLVNPASVSKNNLESAEVRSYSVHSYSNRSWGSADNQVLITLYLKNNNHVFIHIYPDGYDLRQNHFAENSNGSFTYYVYYNRFMYESIYNTLTSNQVVTFNYFRESHTADLRLNYIPLP